MTISDDTFILTLKIQTSLAENFTKTCLLRTLLIMRQRAIEGEILWKETSPFKYHLKMNWYNHFWHYVVISLSFEDPK